jgi:hypothetical protein
MDTKFCQPLSILFVSVYFKHLLGALVHVYVPENSQFWTFLQTLVKFYFSVIDIIMVNLYKV